MNSSSNDDQNNVFPQQDGQNNIPNSTSTPYQGQAQSAQSRLEELQHVNEPQTTEYIHQGIPNTQANEMVSGSSYDDAVNGIPVYTNPLVQQQSATQGQTYDQQSASAGFDIGSYDLNQQPQEVQKTINKDAIKGGGDVTGKMTLQKKLLTFLSTKWWIVVGVVLLIAVISVSIFYFISQPPSYESNAFTNVAGRIEAPSTSPSGTPAAWKVVIQNKESVTIRDVEVKLNFDRSFQYMKAISPDPADPSGDTYRFASLAGLGQGTSEVIIQFEGVLTGNIDENTLMSGTITYTPDPLINSVNKTRTISIAEVQTRITAPEISVNLTAKSDSVQNGGEVELTATFENLSEKDLQNIRVLMEYPSGSNFEYKTSQLQLRNTDIKTKPDDGRNIWYAPVLPRLQSATLLITGNVFGADGVRQAFRIEIGSRSPSGDYETLATDAAEVLVTSQPLIISTKIEGKETNKTFAPGETLNFVVDYQNKSNSTIQNVELFGLIEDPANLLDYSTMIFVGGNIGNLSNRVIQWRGNGVPQLVTLTPQVSGSVRYSVKVKSGDAFIESALNQSSYTLRPRAQAKATNIPQFEIGGDLYQAKGDMTFTQKVEPLAKDPNQANKQNFKVTWEIKTRQNNVNDVIVETISPLPPTAWNQISIQPVGNAGELSYDPLTGKIVWTPANVAAYTGISNPVKSISFELTVVTTGGSVSNTVIYNELQATGVDDFTGEKYEITISPTKANN